MLSYLVTFLCATSFLGPRRCKLTKIWTDINGTESHARHKETHANGYWRRGTPPPQWGTIIAHSTVSKDYVRSRLGFR